MPGSVSKPPTRSKRRSFSKTRSYSKTRSFFQTVEPSRLAAILLIVSSPIEFLFKGIWIWFPLILGLALLMAEDELRVLTSRFLAFAWCLVLLMPHIPTSLYEALYEISWGRSARTFLFAGAILGLLFDSLPRPAVVILTLIGFGALFLPGYVLL